MTEAIFGLVGVVIGGLLTGVTSLWIERARERREARAAARLLHVELIQIASQLQLAVQLNGPLPLVQPFPTDTWRELRPVLARTLESNAWGAAVAAYTALAPLTGMTRAHDFESEMAFNADGLALVEATLKSVTRALDDIARVADVPSAGRERVIAELADARSQPTMRE